MKTSHWFLAGWLIFLFCGGVPGYAASSQFTITASNVTMSASGKGASQFTISEIPVTGTIVLSCGYSGSLALGGLPICPQASYPVKAGGTLTGTVYFYPPVKAAPAEAPAAGAILGGVLVLLLGWRRRGRWWITGALVAAGCLTGMAGVVACGGGSSMPKGNFPYTITAVNGPAAGSGPSFETNVTISVTVP